MRINVAIVEDDADIRQSLQEIISFFEELDCVAACAGATGNLVRNFHHDPFRIHVYELVRMITTASGFPAIGSIKISDL
jgi:hypothetical protein